MGGSFGCLVCMLCGRVFHKDVLKARFTIFCLLLSVAIAVVTLQLIFSPTMFDSVGKVVRSHLGFFVLLFALGVFASCFWRTFLPVAVMAYIAFSVFVGIKLYAAFGANEDTLSVSVNATSVRVNEQQFAVQEGLGKSIVLKTYTLPPEILLPLPRIWYTVCGVSSSKDAATYATLSELADFSGAEPAAVSFSGEDASSFFGTYLIAFREWLLAKSAYQLLPLPDTTVFPSLYSIRIQVSGEKIRSSVTRNL